jgi:hypothetical protein
VGQIPILPRAVMTRGPSQDPELSEAAELEGLKVWPAEPWPYSGGRPKWGRYGGAPVTEGAVCHNGADGRAFDAIWDLRLVDCRAAGRSRVCSSGRPARVLSVPDLPLDICACAGTARTTA